MLTLRIVFALLFIYTQVLTILTQSRGAYLAAAGAFGIILVIRWPRLLFAVPLLILGVAALFRQIGWQILVEQSSRDGTLAGWGGRLEIWQHSLTAIQDFPFTGIGIGTFTIVFPRLYPLSFPVDRYPHAHNLVLQIGIDMGLPGAIAYMALLINLYAMLFVMLRSYSLHSVRWVLTVGALGSCVDISVHGLLDAVVWGTKIAFLPWVVYTLVTVLFLQY